MLFCLQLRNCRASQNQLELDLNNKESALGIDTICHQLNNHTQGLQYYSGIEKYDPWYLIIVLYIYIYYINYI